MQSQRRTTLSVDEVNKKLKGQSKWNLLSFSTVNKRRSLTGNFKCECGTEKIKEISEVFQLRSTSCGCNRIGKFTRRKYSVVNHTIYLAYKTMINRCYNSKGTMFKNYGAKGVIVCNEWINDYENFLHWSLINGWQKGLQLDKDILGNGKLYSPNTCKWVTAYENMNNRSTSIRHELDGKMLTLSEACKLKGLNRSTISSRIKRGLSFQQAFNT